MPVQLPCAALARLVNTCRNDMATTEEHGGPDWNFGASGKRLERLIDSALPGARIVRVVNMKPDAVSADASSKGAGYGAPLRIDVVHGGRNKSLVLHTATSNEFGHDRRADRAQEMILAADTFGDIPGHVQALDVGAYRGENEFVSLKDSGEFYLLSTYAEGRLYAEDLRSVAATRTARPLDIARADALAQYLATLHAERPTASPGAYSRCIRDLLGSGEGIFGIVDGYPMDVPAAPPERLQRIEERCLEWRWRLRGGASRLSRTHGDFHPFNVLFDGQSKLSLLDTSRGSIGDPADDVTCMALNYAFFALGHPGAWREAFRQLWDGFWRRYSALRPDEDLYEVAAPFLAWRGLVLANPKWYPELGAGDRERLLSFVEHALSRPRFLPDSAGEFFDT